MNWKRVGGILLGAFVVYFVVRAPVESANVVRGMFSASGRFLNSVAVALTTFLQTLF